MYTTVLFYYNGYLMLTNLMKQHNTRMHGKYPARRHVQHRGGKRFKGWKIYKFGHVTLTIPFEWTVKLMNKFCINFVLMLYQ